MASSKYSELVEEPHLPSSKSSLFFTVWHQFLLVKLENTARRWLTGLQVSPVQPGSSRHRDPKLLFPTLGSVAAEGGVTLNIEGLAAKAREDLALCC